MKRTTERAELASKATPEYISGCRQFEGEDLCKFISSVDFILIWYKQQNLTFKSFILIQHMPPENRNLGFVFQDYALFPHLNVFENVGFGLGRKVKDRKIKIQSIIEMIDLKNHEKKYPNQLSGGQQQRVAIGRALAINPSAILMDEPFSNLDFSLKSILSNEVKKIIKNTGTTTIMVTHDEREAERLSDECFLLENGKIRKIQLSVLMLNINGIARKTRIDPTAKDIL